MLDNRAGEKTMSVMVSTAGSQKQLKRNIYGHPLGPRQQYTCNYLSRRSQTSQWQRPTKKGSKLAVYRCVYLEQCIPVPMI